MLVLPTTGVVTTIPVAGCKQALSEDAGMFLDAILVPIAG